jgi:phosphoribosylanthranilate isomerase
VAAWAGEQGFRILLAGGLDSSNVHEAVEATVPYGVDVCRGVELEPGVKDMNKVRRFIEEVKQCL